MRAPSLITNTYTRIFYTYASVLVWGIDDDDDADTNYSM